MSDEQVSDDGLACQQAKAPQPLTPYGLVGSSMPGTTRAMTEAESDQYMRDAAVQQAVYILEEARKIKADAVLMADVRARIRKLRDDGAALLDDIGG